MSTGKRIANLRKQRGLNQVQLAKDLNVSSSTIAMWETDKRAIKDDTLVQIANYFSVSIDYLLGRNENNNYWKLNEKDKKDIGKLADEILEGLTTEADVNYYGEPMTEDEKEQMRKVIELGLELNKKTAKKNFTPKKYRNSDSDNKDE